MELDELKEINTLLEELEKGDLSPEETEKKEIELLKKINVSYDALIKYAEQAKIEKLKEEIKG